MKIRASFNKTDGRTGAECSIEFDTKKTDPASIATEIRAAYLLATAAVEAQLAEQAEADRVRAEVAREDAQADAEARAQAEADARALARPPARSEPVLEPLPRRRPAQAEPEPEPEPRAYPAHPHGAGGFSPDDPQDGRQLLAMLRRWAAEDGIDRLPLVGKWAKQQGLDWRVIRWDEDTVFEAMAYLRTTRQPTPTRPTNGRAPSAF